MSSDRDIANHAWAVNSIPVPSDAFIRIVSGKVEGSKEGLAGGSGYEEDDEDAFARKGNPYKLSKKEKSVRRALSKL